MATSARQRFVHWQLAWMLATILVLSLLGALTLKQFFVFSLVGFLVLVEFLAPVNVTPRWRKRLRWFVLLGLLGFAYVVVQVFLDVLREVGV
jgi:hypothetical protein